MREPRPALPMTLPPSLWAATPRESLREGLRQARWLLASYWLLLVTSYVALLAVAYDPDSSARTRAGIAAALLTSLAGVALGNVLGLLRVRPWLVNLATVVVTAVLCLSAGAGGGPVLLYGVAFAWSVACGHLCLQHGTSLAATWVPVICWVGCILTLVERRVGLGAWQGGRKHGVWDPLTLALLLVAVTEVLLFFAGQEHYHAAVWRAHASGRAARVERRGAPARLTGRGALVLLLSSAVVCGAVAVASPYLWRTGPADGRDGSRGAREPRDTRERHDGDWDALVRGLERALREAERSGRTLLPFVPLFLLNRPVRRWVLLRHLRRPLVPVPPSRRARNLWRTVLIALGDAGLEPRPGESLDEAVERVTAAHVRAGRGVPEGLAESAALHQRIRHGLGIPPGAIDALGLESARAFAAVRAPLSRRARVRSWWRRLEA